MWHNKLEDIIAGKSDAELKQMLCAFSANEHEIPLYDRDSEPADTFLEHMHHSFTAEVKTKLYGLASEICTEILSNYISGKSELSDFAKRFVTLSRMFRPTSENKQLRYKLNLNRKNIFAAIEKTPEKTSADVMESFKPEYRIYRELTRALMYNQENCTEDEKQKLVAFWKKRAASGALPNSFYALYLLDESRTAEWYDFVKTSPESHLYFVDRLLEDTGADKKYNLKLVTTGGKK